MLQVRIEINGTNSMMDIIEIDTNIYIDRYIQEKKDTEERYSYRN